MFQSIVQENNVKRKYKNCNLRVTPKKIMLQHNSIQPLLSHH